MREVIIVFVFTFTVVLVIGYIGLSRSGLL